MAQVTVNLPTPPKDWKTTALGIIGAIIVLGKMYLPSGNVTWEGALIAVGIAIIGYFLPAKMTAKDELALEQKVEAVVKDLLTKQPVLPDAEALVAQVVDTLQTSFTVPAPAPLPPAAGAQVQ